MSSTYTSKSGIYYYQRYWLNPETEERERAHFSLRTRDEQEAKKKKKKWDKYYDKKEKGKKPSDVTYEAAKKDYLQMREMKEQAGELSNYTLKSDRNALSQFENWMEETGVEEYIISVEDNEKMVKKFKYWRLERVSKTTVANNLRHLSGFFSWLYDQKIIDNQPLSRIDIPETQRNLNIPTPKEWKEIKKEIRYRVENEDDKFWTALLILARTGMRIGEVIRLTWERAYTDEDKYAYLTQSARTATIYFKKRERRVPLGHIWDEIQSLERSNNTPYLFESPNRGVDTHVGRNTWSRRTSNFLNDLGYEDYTAHSFRHAYITELIRNDTSMKKVADIVGHSHSRIVEIYSHLKVDDLADVMNALE